MQLKVTVSAVRRPSLEKLKGTSVKGGSSAASARKINDGTYVDALALNATKFYELPALKGKSVVVTVPLAEGVVTTNDYYCRLSVSTERPFGDEYDSTRCDEAMETTLEVSPDGNDGTSPIVLKVLLEGDPLFPEPIPVRIKVSSLKGWVAPTTTTTSVTGGPNGSTASAGTVSKDDGFP